MPDPDTAYEQCGHEQMLQAVLLHLLDEHAHDLDDVCEHIGTPALADWDGQPVHLTWTRTFDDAGLLTNNLGVVVDLSDGSQFQLSITPARRPTPPPAATHHHP